MPAKKTPGKSAAKKHGPRADFGQPIDAFFEKQPSHLREILDALRGMIEKIAPTAQASLKWGMPFYALEGGMMCALGAHKAHVNLILAGPPESFDDPDGLLTGDGKTGRHLKLTSLDDLPRKAAQAWIRTAAANARVSAK